MFGNGEGHSFRLTTSQMLDAVLWLMQYRDGMEFSVIKTDADYGEAGSATDGSRK